MQFLVHPYCGGIWYEIHAVNGIHSERLGQFSDPEIAVRVAELLNRNGLVDVPMTEVEAS